MVDYIKKKHNYYMPTIFIIQVLSSSLDATKHCCQAKWMYIPSISNRGFECRAEVWLGQGRGPSWEVFACVNEHKNLHAWCNQITHVKSITRLCKVNAMEKIYIGLHDAW